MPGQSTNKTHPPRPTPPHLRPPTLRHLTAALLAATSFPSFAGTVTSRPYDGVLFHELTLTTPRTLKAYVLEFDLDAPGVSFRMTPKTGSGLSESATRTTSSAVTTYAAQMGINASFYFSDTDGGLKSRGLVASRGTTYSPFEADDRRPWPVLNISQSNIATIVDRASLGLAGTALTPNTTPYNAVSGSERIIHNGIITAGIVSFGQPTELQPRTAVGTTPDGRLFMAVIDGRQSGLSLGTASRETAEILLQFGVTNAINLDGGGSSTMVVNSRPDRVVNSPSDGSERAVATHLLAYANPATTTTDRFVLSANTLGDRGTFGRNPTASTGTTGVLGTSTAAADLNADDPSAFRWSQKISLIDNPATTSSAENPNGSFVRITSGPTGSRTENTSRPSTGYLGLWARTTDADVQISLALDNQSNTTAGRALRRSVIPDGQWHLYQWDITDASQWEAYAGGAGKVTTSTFTVDSLQIFAPNRNVNLFVDEITHDALAQIPTPASIPNTPRRTGHILFADSFSLPGATAARSNTVAANGWTNRGEEPVDYNTNLSATPGRLNATGRLILQNLDTAETTADAVSRLFEPITIPVGSGLCVTADLQSLGGTSALSSTTDGIRLSLTNSAMTDATTPGYGLYMPTGAFVTTSFREFISSAAATTTTLGSPLLINLPDDAPFTITFIIERTATSEVRLSGFYDLPTGRVSLGSVLDTTTPYLTFDQLTLGVGGRQLALSIDNVSVYIPEPATPLVLLPAAVALHRRRRR
jgi:hypothetical protein